MARRRPVVGEDPTVVLMGVKLATGTALQNNSNLGGTLWGFASLPVLFYFWRMIMGSAIYLILAVVTFLYLIFDLAVGWEKFEKAAGGALLSWPAAAFILCVGTVVWPATWFYVALRFLKKIKGSKAETAETDGKN